jgi:hypothetical protein
MHLALHSPPYPVIQHQYLLYHVSRPPVRSSAGSCCRRCSRSSNMTGSPSRRLRQRQCSWRDGEQRAARRCGLELELHVHHALLCAQVSLAAACSFPHACQDCPSQAACARVQAELVAVHVLLKASATNGTISGGTAAQRMSLPIGQLCWCNCYWEGITILVTARRCSPADCPAPFTDLRCCRCG